MQPERPTAEELEAMALVPSPQVRLLTRQTKEEKDLLKKIVIDVAYPLVKEGKKTWQSRNLWFEVLKQYNNEVKHHRLPGSGPMNEIRNLSILLDVLRSISWCDCSSNSKNICECIEPHFPPPSDATQASVSSGSRKRSHESIDSEDISKKVARAVHDLKRSGVLTRDLAGNVSTLYSMMIKKNLHVNVNVFLLAAENADDALSIQQQIDDDFGKFGYLMM